ncbi:MAG TPA: response regulator [Opitutaceae bacterium]|jgi:CheY-like chemotaxis protein|nr:response regulator [Opitutaceae bacterium]
MSAPPPANRRILVVDDNPSIHDDFRRMMHVETGSAELDAAAAALFGVVPAAPAPVLEPFQLSSALQGQQALQMVTAACAAGTPYALAFVDMRMPPGWDGLTTIQKLWEVDRNLSVVICTAYSDYTWEEIRAALPEHGCWMVLKKPFEKIEALQMANALAQRWDLRQTARKRIAELEAALAASSVPA